MSKFEIGLDKQNQMVYDIQAVNDSDLDKTWRSRVAGRARTIGNRVYPKRVSRVQIPPSPPNPKLLATLRVLGFFFALLGQFRSPHKPKRKSQIVYSVFGNRLLLIVCVV